MHNRSKCLLIAKKSLAVAFCTSAITAAMLSTNVTISEENIIPEQQVQVNLMEMPTVVGVSVKRFPVTTGMSYANLNMTNFETNSIIKDANETTESSQSNNNAEESTLESETTTEEVRENKHYYILIDGYRADLPVEYQDYLWELCKQYEVTEHYELFIAQMYRETSFRPNLISGTNDYGLMQINVCNHDWLRKELGITDFLDPYQNMKCGVHIMSGYLHKYNDVQKALVCYNMGESKVKKGIYSSKYSRGVLENLNYLVELED